MVEKTLQDLIVNHHKKINECIDNLISQNELIEYLKKEGIKEEVIKQLQIFINNSNFIMDGGTF